MTLSPFLAPVLFSEVFREDVVFLHIQNLLCALHARDALHGNSDVSSAISHILKDNLDWQSGDRNATCSLSTIAEAISARLSFGYDSVLSLRPFLANRNDAPRVSLAKLEPIQSHSCSTWEDDPSYRPVEKLYTLVCDTLDVSVTETVEEMFIARMERFAPVAVSTATYAEGERETSPLLDTRLPTAGQKRNCQHFGEIASTPKRTTTETNSPLTTNTNENITDTALPPGNLKELSVEFQEWFSKLTNGFKVEREEIDHARAMCNELMGQLEVQRTELCAKQALIDQWISTERQTGVQLKTDASLLDERYTRAKEKSVQLEHRRLLLRLDEDRHAQVLEQIEAEKSLL